MSQDVVTLAKERWQQWVQVSCFAGAPDEFWPLFTRTVTQTLGGELGICYARNSDPEGGERWQVVAHWPGVPVEQLPALTKSVAAAVIEETRSCGIAHGVSLLGGWRVGLMGIRVDEERTFLLLAVHLGAGALPEMEVRQGLATFQSAPNVYELHRQVRLGERDALRLAQAIELLGRVLSSDHFDKAALIVVNDLAERFACETVSMTWQRGGNLSLCALSHSEKIDRRSALTALLEEAGQEALTQGVEVVWPGSGKVVVIAHERYAEMQRPGHLLTLPLFIGEQPLGSLTLERQLMGFSHSEQWALRMLADLLVTPLSLLEGRSRPLWRRLSAETWRSVDNRFKPTTRAGKNLAMGLVVLLLGILMIPVPYSISATAIVKTDTMAFIGAPFDGYLESSPLTLGGAVVAGEVVFSLATRELILEKASILADIAQYQREAEKRRGAGQMPEMQIAEAQVAQAQARLKLVEYRLDNAQAHSPIDGVLVEGEPAKNLGGAVRRGDVVVKIASVSGLYVEAAVREHDVTQIAYGQPVRLTLLANPAMTYAMTLKRIIPAASVKEGENTFPSRAEPNEAVPDWWRPGMSGVAKIDVGYRSLFWIATHRLNDYFRMLFWF